ncbi:threonylcarbamoyl-AMP synthase [Candidatus Saccharibacteria bacterium]|nr:threonylcarbamoyl-AMP synthase [Candidatus Saccharibacteria bacterium]
MIQISPEHTSEIIKALKNGQVVALPTETVFGLAISLNSAKALEKLIFLKRRDLNSGKVFTLVPSSTAEIKNFAVLNKAAREYIAKYIPGELTLILNKNPEFNHPYFNHFTTVGIRIPASSLFAAILPETGPLLLTSANPRGDQPAISSDEVARTLPKVDLIVEGRTREGKLPSTVVDLTKKDPKILRQGDLKVL